MSGRVPRFRQSATLTLVFGVVVAAGAATGAWDRTPPARPGGGPGVSAADVAALSPEQAEAWVAGSGDRWAAYYSPEQYAGLQERMDGDYVGVGLWVERLSASGSGGSGGSGAASGDVVIDRVQPGAPAARAGIAVGDRLRAIDGHGVAGLPVTEVVARLRGIGAVGSAVTLDVAGPAAHAPVRRVVLRRTMVDADDVVVDHPEPGVTRIAVSAFSQETGDEVQAAVHQAEAAPAPGASAPGAAPAGILLDLRGNSGGLLNEAVEAASAFLDGGPVGTYRPTGAGQPAQELTAEPGGDTATPLVVLVDGGTMSAGELLTGALQDRGRAVVVGSRTFGKGSVQAPATLAGGAVVERTVGHYTTPSGYAPDGRGIAPDVAVPESDSRAAAERTALAVLDGLRAAEAPAGGGGKARAAAPSRMRE